jgi:hypothetical protein
MRSAHVEAERRCCEIRLRAERKWGELYAKMEKAKASGANQHKQRSRDTTAPPTIAAMGVSYDEASRAQKLAAVPDDQFERRLRNNATGLAAPADAQRQDRRTRPLVPL